LTPSPRRGQLVRPALLGRSPTNHTALRRQPSDRGDGPARGPRGHHPGAVGRPDRAI